MGNGLPERREAADERAIDDSWVAYPWLPMGRALHDRREAGKRDTRDPWRVRSGRESWLSAGYGFPSASSPSSTRRTFERTWCIGTIAVGSRCGASARNAARKSLGATPP